MVMNNEYASKGVAGAGLGTGIAGLSLGVLNSLGGLGALGGLWGNNRAAQNDALTAMMTVSMLNGRACAPACSENTPASRYELGQAQTIAAKDAEIGLLKADKYTDQKIVDATAYLMGQIKELEGEVRKNKDEQTAVNMQQVAYNATNTATISCLQGQVAALQGMTKLVIPNSSVCPGWGAVKVVPDTATTTPTA